MCRKTALFVLAFALWILWMSAPGAARAATLTVGQLTPACSKALYSTIQSAVNAASSGDTVHICAGTYPEQVFINKSLVVNGDNGAVISPVNVVANSSSLTSGQAIAAVVLVAFVFLGRSGSTADSEEPLPDAVRVPSGD